MSLVSSAYPGVKFDPDVSINPQQGDAPSENAAVLEIVRGRVECSGPVTSAGLANTLGIRAANVELALAQLEMEGLVLRGRFTPGEAGEEFCNRRILARIHRATINDLRKQIEPVSQSTFLQYLFMWQHVGPNSQALGEGGLLEIIGQLQGYEAAAGAWGKRHSAIAARGLQGIDLGHTEPEG